MIIKGHILQLFSLSGRNFFLSGLDVLLKAVPSYTNQVTSQIVSYVENMAVSQKPPLICLSSAKLPKEQTALEKEVNGICSKKVVRGRIYTGYNVLPPETFQLFGTIPDGKYLIHGLMNQEIRRAINKKEPDTPKERGRLTRTLAKLRAHGLIRKIPHSRRYVISDKGRRVLGGLIETKRMIYPEFTAI